MKFKHITTLFIIFLSLLNIHTTVFADDQWDKLNQQVMNNYQAGDYAAATSWADRALTYARENLGEKHQKTLTSLSNLALMYGSQRRYETAEPIYIEALQLSRKVVGAEHPHTVITMNNLASLYQSQGRYDEAAAVYVEILALRKEVLGEKHVDTLTSMNDLALVYGSQGRYEAAENLLVEALELNKVVLGAQHPHTLVSMNNLASTYVEQGHYEAAEDLFNEALELQKEVLGEQHPNILTSLHNLAYLYDSQGRYEEAEPLFVEALELQKEVLGEKHPSTINTMDSLAHLYLNQGRYEVAEPLFVEALALRKDVLGAQHPHTLISMNNLAYLYDSQGRYEDAEPLFVEALELQKKVLGEQHPKTLTSVNNLASLYQSQGRYEDAEPLFVKALELRKQVLGKQHPDTLTGMNNLANLYQYQGRYEEAEPLYVKVLELRKQVLGKQDRDTLASMASLAALYKNQGRHEAAEPLYVESLALYRKVLGEQHPQTLIIMNNLAFFYVHQGRYEAAEVLSDKELSATQEFHAQVLWAAGEQTRASYIQKETTQTYFYLSLFSHRATDASARRALALSLNRKGLLLEIATQIRAVSRSVDDPALKALASALEDNRQRLAALFLSSEADPADISALEETVNQQQAVLGRQVQQLGRSSQTVSPEQVIDALDNASVFVDFLVYRPYTPHKEKQWQAEHLLALVVSKQNKDPIRILELGELAPIRQAIERYRSDLRRAQPLTAQGEASARQLYQALWAPLQPDLDAKQRVYLAPDGILNLLPFATLIDDQGHYLIERHELIMLSSGRDLVLPTLQVKVTDPVVLAAPLYEASQAKHYAATAAQRQAITTARAANALYFTPLPGTLKEGDALMAQLTRNRQSARYYKLATATESAVAAVQSPRILHLATHGFFLEDLPIPAAERDLGQQRGVEVIVEAPSGLPPDAANTGNPLLRSGLALVDANLATQATNDEKSGILTAEEVLDLQLSGTKLVVLSACETGVGEIKTGEGVYGLRRAFQEAGAQSVLSTLWSISDEGTQHFMDRFYQRFLAGMPPQNALRETQLEFMQSDNWTYPFYWAPFVMVGTQ